LERLALYIQGVDSIFDLAFNDPQSADFKSYGDVFLENERQFSSFEQEVADVATLKRQFEDAEAEVPRLLAAHGRQGQALALPAYDLVLKASHLFNLMDARGAISVAERQKYIARVRDLCKACALAWMAQQAEAS
ncbi:MAG: glycine--tRNA ligase subunit alpha, partial [Caulobacteraceae bacterium]